MRIDSEQDMRLLGQQIGKLVSGGEVVELIGDVGAGKTTLTKGLAIGMSIEDTIQSPTFTISRNYKSSSGLNLIHYDFYRLPEAGIMSDEISEAISDPESVVVIEWAGAVEGVLPKDRLKIKITAISDRERSVVMNSNGDVSDGLLSRITKELS